MQARRVDKNDLSLRLGHNSLDAVARRLRFGGDNRDLLPDQAIHERGLPGIGPSYDGHKSGPKSPLFSAAIACIHQGFTTGSSVRKIRFRISTALWGRPSSACESARAI